MAFTKTNTAVINNNTNVKHNEAAFRAQVQAALNHITARHRAATLCHLRDTMLARHYAHNLPTSARRIAALTAILRVSAKRTAVLDRKRDLMRSAALAKARTISQRRQEALREAIVLERAMQHVARLVPQIFEQRRLEQDIDASRKRKIEYFVSSKKE
ncbi:hypothetical protein LTR10_010554 [Elasticomyces elasticus]|nr:hypothetical protein LTR10_010554 [Elasticomyces elasticus]KAK4972455.1 hypothetical protein LTR42_006964 [Elasticomyces elasticus]